MQEVQVQGLIVHWAHVGQTDRCHIKLQGMPQEGEALLLSGHFRGLFIILFRYIVNKNRVQDLGLVERLSEIGSRMTLRS